MSDGKNRVTHDNNHDATVETLKSPPLRIEPAPFAKRALAALADSIIVAGVWISFLLWLHVGFLEQFTLSAGYLAATTLLYYVLLEGAFASTVGKHLLRLRVVGRSGDPASLRESLIRNFLRLIDWLPLLYLVGLASIAVSSKRQRLGDIAAGTIVTPAREKDINPPPAPFLFH
ncbi:MAG TPA: RDD family protein [archaeon]|nr:RDD family protein [archaeon]